ncbi:hypothetical protein AAG570_008384, partial [Ranatra chinensis]
KWTKRIFSGIQPTGAIHVGNYFGAIKKWVELQNSGHQVIYSIVDLHSITSPQVLYHTMLCWVLGSLTTTARLAHFPQFKEKSALFKDVTTGLLIYPVLQAADILLYKATEVPVGEDQVQHIHLAQHLVHTFNNRYGETFPIPSCLVQSGVKGGRIRSLREPDRKMSKSHADAKSRIELADSPDVITAKIRKAVTDFTSSLSFEPNSRPGVSNLVALYSLATGKTTGQTCEEFAHFDTGKFKLVVADAVIAHLKPIREEIIRLNNAPEFLEKCLSEGAEKANIIAEDTWSEVCQKIGLSKRGLMEDVVVEQ